MAEVDRHFAHAQAGAQRGQQHARLDAPSPRQRLGRLEGRPGEAPHTVQRLGDRHPGTPRDLTPRQAHRSPAPARTLARRDDRDAQVGLAGKDGLDQRRQGGGRLAEVGVDEEQRSRRARVLGVVRRRIQLGHPCRTAGHGGGLAAIAGVPHHAVSSVLPSSTTTTTSTCASARTAVTVAAMRSASSLAGMIAATAVGAAGNPGSAARTAVSAA